MQIFFNFVVINKIYRKLELKNLRKKKRQDKKKEKKIETNLSSSFTPLSQFQFHF